MLQKYQICFSIKTKTHLIRHNLLKKGCLRNTTGRIFFDNGFPDIGMQITKKL